MSNHQELIYYDIDYFNDRCKQSGIKPTIDQEERFCDRVWKMVDCGVPAMRARILAYSEIMGEW